ncbi:putative Chitobiosyldiphosphodolichol beta-mannosyltransferase [Blattamonas nauphoetae]|uniref:Beta-1,4-mannosyltransferase n=1 Tax=Blattamonas nauphoetae TaxID=2049346 RepID=A0ABQ9Y4G2_9EUKA|nr:putative Chitobiosyldiphosphodolichol beta-mannosyltransferase [Blattamonas nauphoetae]
MNTLNSWLLLFVIILLTVTFVWFERRHSDVSSIAIVVLGDVGHSPRMQYHSLSFAQTLGVEVDLIGFSGSKCRPEVLENSSIRLHEMKPFPKIRGLPFIVTAPLKILSQILQLCWVLLTIPNPSYIYMQNPPSIPSMIVCLFVSILRGSRFAIDWHNLAFSILALRLGSKSPLVKLSFLYEKTLGRFSSVNTCVSKAMKEWLEKNFKVEATVMYDQPPDFFQPGQKEDVHSIVNKYQAAFNGFDFSRPKPTNTPVPPANSEEMNQRLSSLYPTPEEPILDHHFSNFVLPPQRQSSLSFPLLKYPQPSPTTPYNSSSRTSPESTTFLVTESETPFSIKTGESVELKGDRPAILISPTSWTPDEDFSVLLKAFRIVDERIATHEIDSFPRVAMCVTGKGPLIEPVLKFIEDFPFSHFSFHPLWLDAADYPKMLASADLGISMHQSSSGIDLPMKVVDMFGCCIPVCARNFSCIGELVQHEVNGLLFDTPEELADHLIRLLNNFPNTPELLGMRQTLVERNMRWTSGWTQAVAPLFS